MNRLTKVSTVSDVKVPSVSVTELVLRRLADRVADHRDLLTDGVTLDQTQVEARRQEAVGTRGSPTPGSAPSPAVPVSTMSLNQMPSN